MQEVEALKARIRRRNYLVGVIGLGHVGLPLILRFAQAGFKVLGFDVDPEKVADLNRGSSYIHHVPSAQLPGFLASGRFEATDDFTRLNEPDALLICVPTPLTPHREPDLQYVEGTVAAIAGVLRPGQLVCLKSTTYPGTTEEVLLPRLAAGGLGVGAEFFLAFAPEREDPGNPQFPVGRVPKVVGGITASCLDLACALFAEVVEEVVPVSSTGVAEASKMLENVYRAVNIALVNELKVLLDRMGINAWEVVEAASTKPFGFQAFYPGPGMGGHCIPVDPFYLTWKAREYGRVTRFIELAGEVNLSMPGYVVQKVADSLNACGKAVKGARILVLGVAYKKDVGDLRESPSLEILGLLQARGARLDYSDPYFPRLPRVRRYAFDLESVGLGEEVVQQYDVVVLVTDHSSFPYDVLFRSAKLIVDARNAFRQRGLVGPHVVPA